MHGGNYIYEQFAEPKPRNKSGRNTTPQDTDPSSELSISTSNRCFVLRFAVSSFCFVLRRFATGENLLRFAAFCGSFVLRRFATVAGFWILLLLDSASFCNRCWILDFVLAGFCFVLQPLLDSGFCSAGFWTLLREAFAIAKENRHSDWWKSTERK